MNPFAAIYSFMHRINSATLYNYNLFLREERMLNKSLEQENPEVAGRHQARGAEGPPQTFTFF